MTEPMPPRQTGAETGAACPTCGTPMQVTTSAYGSTSSRCPSCVGAAPQTAAASAPRETGTDVTVTTTEESTDA